MTNRQEAVAKLGGVFKEITVNVERKKTDGNYGSYGVSMGATINVPANENPEELARALDAYLTAEVSFSMQTKKDAMVVEEPVAKSAPVAQEVRTPIGDDGEEYDIFDVTSIVVEYSPGGEKRAKAKGGKWAKFGVMVWHEVLALPPLEWDLTELDAVEVPAPVGLKAKALMVGGKPKKVVEWL